MTKPPRPTPSFFSRYLVTIVCIPSIIAIHIGWSALQKNRTLVAENEEIELPPVTFYKYCLKKLAGDETKTKVAAAKAGSS